MFLVLTQDTLAAFIEEGHLARHHVRKMHKIYDERRSLLLQSLSRNCDDRLCPIGANVVLHLTAELAAPLQASNQAEKASTEGIRLQTLERNAANWPAPNGLALGYGMIRTDRIDEAILAGIAGIQGSWMD